MRFVDKLRIKWQYWQRLGKPLGVVPKKDIRPFLPENPVIVEAGAHIGSDTVEMAQLWRDATIHAFEPIPDLYRQLVRNTEGSANVHTYPLALGEASGEVTLHISSGRSDASSSVLIPKKHLEVHPDVLFETRITAEAVTLDDWAKKHNIQKIDMLWLDLQGFELQVLQQSQAVLANVSVIYTEVSLIENYEKGALYQNLVAWLDTQDFAAVREEIAWKDGGNVLFVRKNKLNKHG